jgi:hypothetical protein
MLNRGRGFPSRRPLPDRFRKTTNPLANRKWRHPINEAKRVEQAFPAVGQAFSGADKGRMSAVSGISSPPLSAPGAEKETSAAFLGKAERKTPFAR